jgi:hypothetical protein
MFERLPNLHVPAIQTLGERYSKLRLWWYMFAVMFVGDFWAMMALFLIDKLTEQSRLPVLWQLGSQRLSFDSIALACLLFAGLGWLMGWMLGKVAVCRVRSVVLAALLGYWAAYILFNWPPSQRLITNIPHTTYYRHMLMAMLTPIGCVAGSIALVMRPTRWAWVWLFSQLALGFLIASASYLYMQYDIDGSIVFFGLSIMAIYPLVLSIWFSYYLRRQIVPF